MVVKSVVRLPHREQKFCSVRCGGSSGQSSHFVLQSFIFMHQGSCVCAKARSVAEISFSNSNGRLSSLLSKCSIISASFNASCVMGSLS